MTIKNAAGLAFAAACLTSVAAISVANAQTAATGTTAPGYYGPQTYPSNAVPNSTAGTYGSAPGTYAPQVQQNYTYPNTATGGYGSSTSGYAPQNYQGTTSPSWSEGGYGSTTGNYSPPTYQPYSAPTAAGTGGTEQLVTNGPQGNPPANWSPQRNNIESERYDRLLETNRAFRQARMRKECGPITDPTLHANCVASFNQYEPYAGTAPAYGSSSAPQYEGNYGR